VGSLTGGQGADYSGPSEQPAAGGAYVARLAMCAMKQARKSSCGASVLNEKFLEEVSPRSGRKDVAYGVSRG